MLPPHEIVGNAKRKVTEMRRLATIAENKFKMDLLVEYFAAMTEEQQLHFHKLFPAGVSKHKRDEALELLERTLKKNMEGRE